MSSGFSSPASGTFTTAGGSADVDDKDHRVTFGLGMKF